MKKASPLLSRRATALFIGIIAATGLAVIPHPALAINGRDAVGLCIDSTASGARCGWAVSRDGSIDICNKNGCVTCPSAEGECIMASKKRPDPTMPIGTRITTEFGTYVVRPFDGRRNIGNAITAAQKAKRSRRY